MRQVFWVSEECAVIVLWYYYREVSGNAPPYSVLDDVLISENIDFKVNIGKVWVFETPVKDSSPKLIRIVLMHLGP